MPYIVDEDTKEVAEVATLPVQDCLEYGDDCKGIVDLHTTGNSLKAWPRCEHHADRRQERYENSSEVFADSDLPPADFHRGWGGANEYGEHWSEEDY